MTEWNVKRILLAVAIAVFVIWLPFYMFNADTYENELEDDFNQQQDIPLNVSEPTVTKIDIPIPVVEKEQNNNINLNNNEIKEEKNLNLESSLKLPDATVEEIKKIVSSDVEDDSKLKNENSESVEEDTKILAENIKNVRGENLDNIIKEETPLDFDSSTKTFEQPVEEIKNKEVTVEEDDTSPVVENNNQVEDIDNVENIQSGNVPRAILTTGVKQKEPVDNVSSPVYVGKQAAIKLHYFTEIINKDGDILYHHWKREGQSIFKRKITISGNRWRASTNKFIQYFDQGEWSVILETDEGDVLSEIKFQVVGK